MIRGECSAYWTVYDGAYEPVGVADAYLRRLRFGSGKALGTTRVYASNLVLFFEFCVATGRSLRRAALEFDRFVHFLAVTPIERAGRGQGQLRSPERVNHILSAVRELYRETVARGLLDGEVLWALFRVERGYGLPVGIVEDQDMTLHERPRHRLRVAKPGRPGMLSFEQFAGLMAACRTWRDRSILALMGRAGLRRGRRSRCVWRTCTWPSPRGRSGVRSRDRIFTCAGARISTVVRRRASIRGSCRLMIWWCSAWIGICSSARR